MGSGYQLMPWALKYKAYFKGAAIGTGLLVSSIAAFHMADTMFSLASLRENLLTHNLYDATSEAKYKKLNLEIDLRSRNCTQGFSARTADGSCNNLDNHAMGMAFVRFGRNVDPAETFKEDERSLLSPNPREISRRLLTRKNGILKPANIVNFAAASWLQFMTHDWFNHGDNQNDPNGILATIELAVDDPLRSFPIDKITVYKTALDPNEGLAEVESINHRGVRTTLLKKGYHNIVTHWWDGSQIYGSDDKTLTRIRGLRGLRGMGEVLLVKNNMPVDEDGLPVTGLNENWWLGLQMMHQLFLLEHNSIAKTLAAKHPFEAPDVQVKLQSEYIDLYKSSPQDAYDRYIFDKARLVNTASMAKIHSIEWTPAILKNKTLDAGMTANWSGIIKALKRFSALEQNGLTPEQREAIIMAAGKVTPYDKRVVLGRNHLQDQKHSPISLAIVEAFKLNTALGIEKDGDPGINLFALSTGLVGTRTALAGVPFTLTEEFVSVYRMHSLLRDVIDIYDHGTGKSIEHIKLADSRNADAVKISQRISPVDLWYSFGVTHPGALTLGNFPTTLQNLKVPYRKFPLVQVIDMGTVDILRDRERGVPRYNRFRHLLGMKTVDHFEDFGLDPETTKVLSDVYGADMSKVDLLIGCLAESIRPDGYGFGETAFQIFALMASRRLMADRFFSESYTADVYTQEGLDWIDNTSMKRVLLRHFPELAPALAGAEDGNAFRPWKGEIKED